MLHSSVASSSEFSVRYAVLAALVSLVCWVLADGVFSKETTTLAAAGLLTAIVLFVLLSYL